MPARTPKVFGIGLPHSGARVLGAVFDANGYTWRHHQNGKLAQSIAYAEAARSAPLSQWPNAAGFSGLYRMHKRHLPQLRVRDMIAPLRAAFPDAYFINTQRDPADWITARFWAEDGEHRTAAAWHANIKEADMPDHWMAEHTEHAAFCADLFDDDPRFLDFNVTT